MVLMESSRYVSKAKVLVYCNGVMRVRGDERYMAVYLSLRIRPEGEIPVRRRFLLVSSLMKTQRLGSWQYYDITSARGFKGKMMFFDDKGFMKRDGSGSSSRTSSCHLGHCGDWNDFVHITH